MKIKTITCHNVYNAGATLQTYALLTYLKNLNHDVEIIDYQPDYLTNGHKLTYVSNPKYRKNLILKLIYILVKAPGKLSKTKLKRIFDEFHKENYCLTKEKYTTIEELKANPPIADLYIAGSDQIWNTLFRNGKDPSFYLEFSPNDSVKSSYAASFATNEINEEYKSRINKWLNNIDYISVREKTGLEMLKKYGINRGQCVVDPVFLMDKSFWEEMCYDYKIEADYILIYDFDRSEIIENITKELSKKHNLKIWSIFKSNYSDKHLKNVGPLEFITYIKNAKCVLSNSFHGTAFSIIFNKEFYVIKRNENINTRMEDLLKSINASERLINSKEDLIKCKSLDYNSINEIMNKNIKNSKDYIDFVIKETEKRREYVV